MVRCWPWRWCFRSPTQWVRLTSLLSWARPSGYAWQCSLPGPGPEGGLVRAPFVRRPTQRVRLAVLCSVPRPRGVRSATSKLDLFCAHDTSQFAQNFSQRCCCSAMTSANEKGVGFSSLRRRRMRALPSQPTSRLQRSSHGLLGLILEQGIESLNQVIRWSPLDDCTSVKAVPRTNPHQYT